MSEKVIIFAYALVEIRFCQNIYLDSVETVFHFLLVYVCFARESAL